MWECTCCDELSHGRSGCSNSRNAANLSWLSAGQHNKNGLKINKETNINYEKYEICIYIYYKMLKGCVKLANQVKKRFASPIHSVVLPEISGLDNLIIVSSRVLLADRFQR